MKTIARIQNSFVSKFDIPRQSGVIKETESRIVFEPEFRIREAVRGLEDYEYVWLIWVFTENGNKWHPTVRPPRLGGNKRVGVFATRSPFRPNPIGLSSVRLLRIDQDETEGPVLVVSGADLMNGTEIIDIKPYLPYTDSHESAKAGFSDYVDDAEMTVVFSDKCMGVIDEEDFEIVKAMLAKDPRPSYQDDERVYGMAYNVYDIHFVIKENTVTVLDIQMKD